MKVKNLTKSSTGLIELFRKAYNSETGNKITSCMDEYVLNLQTHSIACIKTKWEKKGGITIPENEYNMEKSIEVYQFIEMEGVWLEKADKLFIIKFHHDSNVPVCWKN